MVMVINVGDGDGDGSVGSADVPSCRPLTCSGAHIGAAHGVRPFAALGAVPATALTVVASWGGRGGR